MFSRIQRLQYVFLRPAAVRRTLFHTKQSSRLFQEAKAHASSSGKTTQEAPKKGIRQLMSQYGYSALGVYFALSGIDLPLSFLLVHSMGQEKIVELETTVKEFLGYSTEVEDSTIFASVEGAGANVTIDNEGAVAISDGSESEEGWRSYFTPTLLTEFGIAYALHKSFIFVRVPLTAAITPKVVTTLQRWGFNIGKKVVK